MDPTKGPTMAPTMGPTMGPTRGGFMNLRDEFYKGIRGKESLYSDLDDILTEATNYEVNNFLCYEIRWPMTDILFYTIEVPIKGYGAEYLRNDI
jgi:hypothetical protein